jgi:hypothetical protein
VNVAVQIAPACISHGALKSPAKKLKEHKKEGTSEKRPGTDIKAL